MMNQPTHPKRRRGLATAAFTLIELVLVLTLIMILMGAGIYFINQGGVIGTAQETQIKANVESMTSPLQLYFSRNGRYPTTEQGLMALVEKPTAAPLPSNWTRLLDEVPTDPWKQPYRYRYPAQKSNKPFDIYSIGQDGQENTADDIGNWTAAPAK